MADTLFSSVAQAQMAVSRVAFETRFAAIQQGIANRINQEIDTITNDGTERRLGRLQDDRNKIVEGLPAVREYLFNMDSNRYRMADIQNYSADALLIDMDGDANTFSADEVSALTRKITEITDAIDQLNLVTSPDVTDGDVLNKMRGLGDQLKALTPTAGMVDAEGTVNPTNDNRAILDLLSEINTHAEAAFSMVSAVVDITSGKVTSMTNEVYKLEADMTEITSLEISEKTQKINDIKTRYGIILESLSLSFEVNSGLGDLMANSLQGYRPPKGSILNLFI